MRAAREAPRSLAPWLAYRRPPPLLLRPRHPLRHSSPRVAWSRGHPPPPRVPGTPGRALLWHPGPATSTKLPVCSGCWGTTPPGGPSRTRPRGNPPKSTVYPSRAGTAEAVEMEERAGERSWAARVSAPAPGTVRGRPLWTVRRSAPPDCCCSSPETWLPR